MNFDRFNPLSSNFIYNKQNTPNEPQQDAKLNVNSEVSDWGIEEDLTPTSALGTTFSNYLSPTASSTTTTVHTNTVQLPPPPPQPPSMSNRQSSYSSYSASGILHDDTFLPPHPMYIHHHQQQQSHQQQQQQSPFKRRNSINSNSSSQFNQQHYPYQSQNHHPLYLSHSHASQLNLLQYCQYSGNVIYPNTETLSKFIEKYLSMEHKLGEFWEKFKYNLIISNLLEDSMILSKNESSLQLLNSTPISAPLKHLKFTINDDGTRLIVLNTSYQVKYNYRCNNFTTVILIINLIIYLLKQQQSAYLGRQHMTYESQFALFKFILAVSSKLIKIRKFKTIVETNKILDLLNDFLKLNYIANKNLILNMVKLKSKKLDLVAGNSNSTHLLNSLSFLNLTLRSLIVKLLPHINGDLFQQYCTINNINVGILTQEFDNENQDELEKVIFNINKFNQLRKLLICQLITINENASCNFFTLNLMDQFQTDEVESDLSTFEKVELLHDVLIDHNDLVRTINKMFTEFDTVLQPQEQLPSSDEDITFNLQSNLFQFTSRVNKFAHNLSYFNKYNQSLSLNNIEEQYEKLAIFQQFHDELNQLKLLHKHALTELNQEINPDYIVTNSPKSTVSSSPQINQAASFNLKSFQNPSIKKRYSLPPNVTSSASASCTTPTSNGTTTTSSASPSKSLPATNHPTVSSKPKKYKRLSTGLQLGLLTVFEENGDRSPASPAPIANGNRNSLLSTTSDPATMVRTSSLLPPHKVSYDDNYINILPTNQFESYNKSTLDQLISSKTKNRYSNQNNRNSISMSRFSLNSVQSNISGISDLISTQMTSFNGDDGVGEKSEPSLESRIDQSNNGQQQEYDKLDVNESFSVVENSDPGQMTQEELKMKLEASFTKIYNLEAENKKLSKENNYNNDSQGNGNANGVLHDVTNEHHLVEPNIPNASFLKDLETKLNAK
ncbi:hypothetical protein CANMA_002505 [Candida margitis]|uniref:uncharacterized protein n=1 Tax=Candida margitis TaxID=1775924 RepID=UPI002226A31B|nr:uncharacterized protein CANMA_002505 [Candida margitis]KAI5968289.1 hypothetical protein CANMA_002505 [Candida margitis]